MKKSKVRALKKERRRLKQAARDLREAKHTPTVSAYDRVLATKAGSKQRRELFRDIFTAARPPPGVVPEGVATIAMDEQLRKAADWAASMATDQQIVFATGFGGGYGGIGGGLGGGEYSAWGQGLVFMGYPYLAELALRADYRIAVETIGLEMTRKGIEIQVADAAKAEAPPAKPGTDLPNPLLTGARDRDLRSLMNGHDKSAMGGRTLEQAGRQNDEGAEQDAERRAVTGQKDERVRALEDELERLKVMATMRATIDGDGYFGRHHLYLDFNDASLDPDELKTPVGDGRNEVTAAKGITRGSFKRIQPVEAVWSYPANYNSTDPLAPDWYRPQLWFAMGKEVHASRFLTMIGREVSDLFKPAFSFGGLAMTQMIKPTVDNWLRTRESVSDLLHSFTVFKLGTNMSAALEPGGEAMFDKQMQLFTNIRDNKGMFVYDKDTEEFGNVSAALSGLDVLQAQSQEHICSVSQIPLVKYTGISPAGLNASSEGEIRVFYDMIEATQVKRASPLMDRIFAFAQVNLWGFVDPALSYKWRKLWSLDEKGEAEVRKLDAETDDILAAVGAIDQYEIRTRVAGDEDTPYKGLDLSKQIEKPDAGGGGMESLMNLHNSGEGGSGAGAFKEAAE